MADGLSIARIRAYAVTPAQCPPARYTGREEPLQMELEIVRLTLLNGTEGVASVLCGWDGLKAGNIHDRIRVLSSALLGESVLRRASLTEALLANAGEGPWEAISILDCAMWDAYGRCLGVPLWQLFGGAQSRISAYASTRAFLSVEEYLEEMQRFTAEGYRGIKFHMNTHPDFDLELVHSAATASDGSEVRFMADLEQQYTFDEALRLGKVLEKLPFEWMEAPLPDEDLAAYAELNKALAIDVLPAGNTLVGLQHWRDGLQCGAWSRLRCDATNAGGITTVIKAMALARACNVEVELQSFGFQPAQHANLHLGLGLGGTRWHEHPAPHRHYDYATRNPLVLDAEGKVSAPDRPGLGVDTEWELIEADSFLAFDSRT